MDTNEIPQPQTAFDLVGAMEQPLERIKALFHLVNCVSLAMQEGEAEADCLALMTLVELANEQLATVGEIRSQLFNLTHPNPAALEH